MSVGARGVFNAAYEPLLFDVERIPFPAAGREQATLDALDSACRERRRRGADRRAADPRRRRHADLRAAVLAEMRRICDAHGVLFIADEVMTGWGRTGTLFACEQAESRPTSCASPRD